MVVHDEGRTKVGFQLVKFNGVPEFGLQRFHNPELPSTGDESENVGVFMPLEDWPVFRSGLGRLHESITFFKSEKLPLKLRISMQSLMGISCGVE